MSDKNDMYDQYTYLALYEADEVVGLQMLSPVETGKIAMLREQGYVTISHRAYKKHVRKQLTTPVEIDNKKVVVSTHKQFGVNGDVIHVFFTMVDTGINKQTLSALAHSDEQVDEMIYEVQAFFPDDYEFEFI